MTQARKSEIQFTSHLVLMPINTLYIIPSATIYDTNSFLDMVHTKFICCWQAITLYGFPKSSCKLIFIIYPVETTLLNINFDP